jgi:hypothetical protein
VGFVGPGAGFWTPRWKLGRDLPASTTAKLVAVLHRSLATDTRKVRDDEPSRTFLM